MSSYYGPAPGLELRPDMIFPFKRQRYTDQDIHDMMTKLRNSQPLSRLEKSHKPYRIDNTAFLDPKFAPAEGSLSPAEGSFAPAEAPYWLFIHQNEDYYDFDIISDMFNEEARMQAKVFGTACSPLQWWITHREQIVKQYPHRHDQREMIYRESKECTSFRPILVLLMVDLFGAKSMLDPCGGWGDRLAGAIARDVRYVGIDPNPAVHVGYQKMIDFFVAPSQKERFQVFQAEFEKLQLKAGEKYDLVMTSPPYFQLETYTHGRDKSQSIVNYTTERDWYDNFLRVLMLHAWQLLNPGGHIVLVIRQYSNKQSYCRWLYEEFGPTAQGEWAGAYMGIISYTNQLRTKNEPMWIWQKK